VQNARVPQILLLIALQARQGRIRQDERNASCKIRLAWRSILKLNYATLALLVVFAILFATNIHRFPLDSMRIIGLCIAIPSFVFFVLARIQLGRSFSVQAKATRLVTTGLYSRIRNPIYFFGALMIAGIIVWTTKPVLFLIFVVLIPLQISRSRQEERVLTETFGESYLDYKRKTWF
jgi:protein-S-isoprenylcysteine O-methyltransferase Ste14